MEEEIQTGVTRRRHAGHEKPTHCLDISIYLRFKEDMVLTLPIAGFNLALSFETV